MKNMKFILTLAAIVVAGFFFACSKDNNSAGSTQLTIRMTDTPYNAQEVNVDLKEVRVNMADDSSGWRTLTTNAHVYNLLNFQNGVDTAIATGSVPTGNVRELRLILGPNNSIKINNVTYPLTIPSGEESGLKIKVGKNLSKSADSLLIDFDANRSIYQTGTGEYKLKPVIKLK
jgi:hypothetical protein